MLPCRTPIGRLYPLSLLYLHLPVVEGLIFCISATPHLGTSFPLFHDRGPNVTPAHWHCTGRIFIVHNFGILEFPLLCLQFETEAGVGLGWKCCVQEPDRCGQVAVERQSSGQQSNCYKLRLAAVTRLTLLSSSMCW